MSAEIVDEGANEQQGTDDQWDQYCGGSPWIADSAPAKTEQEECQTCCIQKDADVIKFSQDVHSRSVSQWLERGKIENRCSHERDDSGNDSEVEDPSPGYIGQKQSGEKRTKSAERQKVELSPCKTD